MPVQRFTSQVVTRELSVFSCALIVKDLAAKQFL